MPPTATSPNAPKSPTAIHPFATRCGVGGWEPFATTWTSGQPRNVAFDRYSNPRGFGASRGRGSGVQRTPLSSAFSSPAHWYRCPGSFASARTTT